MRRFERLYRELADEADFADAVGSLPDDALVKALAGAGSAGNAYHANVLATEALNRLAQRDRLEAVRRSVLEANPDAAVAADGEGRVVGWNAAAEEMFGYTREEAKGRGIGELIVPPELREAHERGFRRYRDTGESRVARHRIHTPAMRRDGRTFNAELTIVPIEPPGRAAFVGFIRNMESDAGVIDLHGLTH